MSQIDHPSLLSNTPSHHSAPSMPSSHHSAPSMPSSHHSSPSMPSLSPQSGISTTTILIIILVALIGVFIFLKIQPYLSFLSVIIDYVRTLLNGGVTLAANTTKNIVDQTAEGSNIVVAKVSGKKRKKTEPEPDDAHSSVQSKGAYCYVGEWKGVRSCVRVNGKCESGKTFETEEKCGNPELR